MGLIEVNWHPGRRELQHFALLCTGIFGLFGAYSLWLKGSQPTATACWIVAVAGLVGYIFPNLLRPIYVLWMALAAPIGWVVSHLLLLMVFYLIVTPVGLVMRLLGYDPLNRRIDRSAKSYWTPHGVDADTARYFKQY